MIFRSDMWQREKIKPTVERDHRQISKIAGKVWNQMDERRRAPFKRAAELEKKRHLERYPDYKYAPVYRTKAGKRKTKRDLDLEERRCKSLADLMYAGVVGNALEAAAQQFDAEYAASSIPASSHCTSSTSRAPYASTSRRVASRRATAATQTAHRSQAPEPMSPVVKNESAPTPEFRYVPLAAEPGSQAEPDFVPTSDIPHLSLSGANDRKVSFSAQIVVFSLPTVEPSQSKLNIRSPHTFLPNSTLPSSSPCFQASPLQSFLWTTASC